MTTLPLANGIVIDTSTGQALAPSVEPAHAVAANSVRDKRTTKQQHEAGRDRSNRNIRIGLGDLPADPKAITTVGVVWLYFTLGLSDHEVADACGMRVDQVDMIKGLKLFTQLDDLITHNMHELRKDDVQKRIDAMANDAFDTLAGILEDDDAKPATKARVAQDMLNRAGFTPAQIINHKHTLNGGLIIRHVTNDALPKRMPTIDVDADVVDVEN